MYLFNELFLKICAHLAVFACAHFCVCFECSISVEITKLSLPFFAGCCFSFELNMGVCIALCVFRRFLFDCTEIVILFCVLFFRGFRCKNSRIKRTLISHPFPIFGFEAHAKQLFGFSSFNKRFQQIGLKSGAVRAITRALYRCHVICVCLHFASDAADVECASLKLKLHLNLFAHRQPGNVYDGVANVLFNMFRPCIL